MVKKKKKEEEIWKCIEQNYFKWVSLSYFYFLVCLPIISDFCTMNMLCKTQRKQTFIVN